MTKKESGGKPSEVILKQKMKPEEVEAVPLI